VVVTAVVTVVGEWKVLDESSGVLDLDELVTACGKAIVDAASVRSKPNELDIGMFLNGFKVL
jgi:hypothetical protein